MKKQKIKLPTVKRHEKRNRIFLLTSILVLGIFFLNGFVQAEKTAEHTRIYEGVFLDTVDVGGMTKEEALEAYGDYIKEIGTVQVTFSNAVGSFTVPLSELGIEVSVEDAVEQAYGYGRKGNILSRYKEIEGLKENNVTLIPDKQINEQLLSDKLEENAADMERPAKNASMDVVGGELIRYDGETGYNIDVDQTIEIVKEVLQKKWEQKDLEIEVATKEVEPQYTVDDFYMVDSVLGQFSTEYDSSKVNRSQNVSNGAAKINGTILLPGEQFSMYNTVAPFTEENGYADAGQLVKQSTGTELVNGVGGGICQVSTTLYNAVLEAELQVDERYRHELSVDYVDLSRDAAIAENYMDFKFTNNTGYPVYIESYAGGGTITFIVYGHETRDPGRTLKFVSKKIEEIEPGEPEKIWDDTLDAGTEVTERVARKGYYAELWKEIYQDGEKVDEVRVNQSEYSAQSARIRVGTR